MSIGLLLATFTAGLFSFLSPCTVPLLPAYLACVSGVAAAGEDGRGFPRDYRGRLVLGSLLYVLGFGSVLVLVGLLAGGIGGVLKENPRPIEIVGGIFLIVFGLVITGVLRVPMLVREHRFELPRRLQRGGVFAALPVGIIFGLGWTPCVGAYLSLAISAAAVSHTAGQGAALLFSYALGLGAPFVVVALLWSSLPSLPQRVSKLAGPFTRVGGVVTVVLGIMLVTGLYATLTSYLAQLAPS